MESGLPKVTLMSGMVRIGTQVPLQLTGLLSLQLVKTAELDPSRNYLAGFHPHGVLAAGAFVNLCTDSTGFPSLFPGIRPHLMMLSLWFRAPFFRDYIMSGGESLYPWVAQEDEAGDKGRGSLGRGGLPALPYFLQVRVQWEK